MADISPLDEEAKAFRFNALRNAIYHSSRRGFLDLLNRFLSLIVVAGGALALADLGVPRELSAAAAALAGLLQLVFDFGGTARTHEFLQRRFYELVAEIGETTQVDRGAIRRWESYLARLYAEEPPPMRALDAIAYNAAVDATDPDKKGRIPLRWFHVVFGQIWSFNRAAF